MIFEFRSKSHVRGLEGVGRRQGDVEVHWRLQETRRVLYVELKVYVAVPVREIVVYWLRCDAFKRFLNYVF